MKIDICIPTYNRRDLLHTAIESALRQSYTDIRIIVSDNASSDGTKELMETQYASHPKIRYFRNDTNLWPLENYRKCVYEHSKGDYILFLSDDDELFDPEYITKAVDHLEKYPTSRIVIWNTRVAYTDIWLSFDEEKTLSEQTLWTDFFLKYGVDDYTISWCNALFHAQTARDTSSYDCSVFYVDSDSFFRIMQYGDVGFIDTVASIYAVHAKNSYKIASLETYLNNQSYITRNYNFVLALGQIPVKTLDIWKERLLSWYRINMLHNLLLFSEKPLSNTFHAISELKKDGFFPEWRFFLKIPILFIARYAIRLKPLFRLLVSYNHR